MHDGLRRLVDVRRDCHNHEPYKIFVPSSGCADLRGGAPEDAANIVSRCSDSNNILSSIWILIFKEQSDLFGYIIPCLTDISINRRMRFTDRQVIPNRHARRL
jgi:hypothetical protein